MLVENHRSNSAASSPGAAGPPSNAVPVTVATAQAQDVPIIIRGLGSVMGFNTVEVRSRVLGNVVKVAFEEGQMVKTGDLLVQLDPRPYQAALDQANANLARDQANLENARKDLARYADLLKKSAAPEQQYATQQATVAAAEATVQSSQAAIDQAKLNVEYAAVRSPIDGVTGIRQVDLGNLVQANGQTLVVVTQITPIYVVFTVPETDIDRIRTAMQHGALTVQAYDQADQKRLSDGVLKLVDNQVDQTTGTVKLKAEFPNENEALWPGQFVNAHLVLETVSNGVTVPPAAVLNGPNGQFTYVVRDDNTVMPHDVTVRQTENDRALIGSGLSAGDRVVTAGQFKLSPGAKVTVSNSINPGGQASVAAAISSSSSSPAATSGR